MSDRLECGISYADLALSVSEAMDQATLGLYPEAMPLKTEPGSRAHQARAAALRKLLAPGERLAGAKFKALALEFMHECQDLLNLPRADPLPDVLVIWEAGVRHAAAFLEAETDEVEDLLASAGQWREWAPRQPVAALATT